MTRLESTKKINNIKAKALKKGGYHKSKDLIIAMCGLHLIAFGNDLTPNQFK